MSNYTVSYNSSTYNISVMRVFFADKIIYDNAQWKEWLKCMIEVVKSSGDMKNYKTDFTYKNYTQRYTDVTVSFNDFPVSLQSFLNKYRFEP